jgi:hypothetical protein
MSEDNTTPDAGADTDADDLSQPGEGPKANREARYRVERNQAREALTAAEGRIAAMQTRELERLAGEHLAQPGDLLGLSGIELSAFLDDDGNVDAEAVAEAAADLIEGRPGLAKNPRVAATDPTQGASGGATAKLQPEWVDLFKGGNRGSVASVSV